MSPVLGVGHRVAVLPAAGHAGPFSLVSWSVPLTTAAIIPETPLHLKKALPGLSLDT